MKDQTSGVAIKGLANLKLILSSQKKIMKKKSKGINKNVVDDGQEYEDYKDVLLHSSYMRHELNRIQSKAHNIGLYQINNFLSSYNDKKYILKDGYSRLSNFHKSTR